MQLDKRNREKEEDFFIIFIWKPYLHYAKKGGGSKGEGIERNRKAERIEGMDGGGDRE